jgi:hypothetical protein
MNFTKCDLIKALERYIDAARERGARWVSMPRDDFLLAMLHDQRDGVEQLEAVLQEVCEVCGCSCIIEPANHQHVIAFGVARSGGCQI